MVLLANEVALIQVQSQERLSITESVWSTERGNEGGKGGPDPTQQPEGSGRLFLAIIQTSLMFSRAYPNCNSLSSFHY